MSVVLSRRTLCDYHSRLARTLRIQNQLEHLEPRVLLSATTEILSYHGDAGSTGQNLNETILTPTNVNSATFGKLASIALDGQVYAQPLLVANVNVTRGSSQGVHNVLYVATQHGSLYALDAQTGATLWKDTFLNITDPTQSSATSGVTPVPTTDVVNSADVAPEIGILATPTIDPVTHRMYIDVNTKESRTEFSTTNKHYVQRLWSINIQNGAAINSTVVGDTIMNSTSFNSYTGYQYVSGPWVNGTGNNGIVTNGTTGSFSDGWITNPNDSTSIFAGTTPQAQTKIAFNALLQMNRPAVTLINGKIYLAYASHGDDGPYYGWILGFDAATLNPTAAFLTVPTHENIRGNSNYTSQGGIWMSGDRITTDGTYLYVTTGNGAFNTDPANFDANGFPLDHDYADCVLKLGLDNSTQGSQNGNGWGLTVVDYFTPSNVVKLNQIDADLGSGGVLLIDSNAIPGHPHLLVTGGKEGRLYLIDRDNMGKFNTSYPSNNTTTDPITFDRVLGEATSNNLNSQTHKVYDTTSYFNGRFIAGISTEPVWLFNLSTFATGTTPPNSYSNTKNATFNTNNTASGQVGNTGSRGTTVTITANGTNNAVIWALVNNYSGTGAPADNLLAYDASLTGAQSPIYDSNSNSVRDALTIANGTNSASVGVKFTVPTVANGLVYAELGTKNNGTGTFQAGGIIIYGLLSPTLHTPTSLTASATGTSSIHLTWTRNAADQESEDVVQRSTDGTNWTTVSILGPGSTSFDDSGLSPGAQYFYRVTEVYGSTSAGPSASGNATTQTPALNLVSVVSRQIQGAGLLDLNMPLTGTPGVEYRQGGPKTVIFTFDGAPTLGPSYSATPSSGSVSGTSINGNTLAVNLSGVTNDTMFTLSLNDVSGHSYSVTFGVLLGDLNQTGKVDIDDLTVVANHWQQSGVTGDTDGSNFVDIGDLTNIANNWQTTIVGFGAASGFASSSVAPSTTSTTTISSTKSAAGSQANAQPPAAATSHALITSDDSQDSPFELGNRLVRAVRRTLVKLVAVCRIGN